MPGSIHRTQMPGSIHRTQMPGSIQEHNCQAAFIKHKSPNTQDKKEPPVRDAFALDTAVLFFSYVCKSG